MSAQDPVRGTPDDGPVFTVTAPVSAPSAEPDFSYRLLSHLPNLERLTIASLREALSRAGLAIVPAADVPSAEERKVLEAMADADIHPTERLFMSEREERAVCDAELARRAAKETKTDG